jgi:hypothetical protein
MLFKKQKKTSWFPAPKKKSNKVKKGALVGLAVTPIVGMIFRKKPPQ